MLEPDGLWARRQRWCHPSPLASLSGSCHRGGGPVWGTPTPCPLPALAASCSALSLCPGQVRHKRPRLLDNARVTASWSTALPAAHTQAPSRGAELSRLCWAGPGRSDRLPRRVAVRMLGVAAPAGRAGADSRSLGSRRQSTAVSVPRCPPGTERQSRRPPARPIPAARTPHAALTLERRRRIEELSRSSRQRLLQSRDRMFSKFTSILQHAVEAVRPPADPATPRRGCEPGLGAERAPRRGQRRGQGAPKRSAPYPGPAAGAELAARGLAQLAHSLAAPVLTRPAAGQRGEWRTARTGSGQLGVREGSGLVKNGPPLARAAGREGSCCCSGLRCGPGRLQPQPLWPAGAASGCHRC